MRRQPRVAYDPAVHTGNIEYPVVGIHLLFEVFRLRFHREREIVGAERQIFGFAPDRP